MSEAYQQTTRRKKVTAFRLRTSKKGVPSKDVSIRSIIMITSLDHSVSYLLFEVPPLHSSRFVVVVVVVVVLGWFGLFVYFCCCSGLWFLLLPLTF